MATIMYSAKVLVRTIGRGESLGILPSRGILQIQTKCKRLAT